jgi:hypothetical protein
MGKELLEVVRTYPIVLQSILPLEFASAVLNLLIYLLMADPVFV